MRKQCYSVFRLADLSGDARENAIRLLTDHDYPWFEENIGSVKAFCQHWFGNVIEFRINHYGCSYISTNLDHTAFRGFRLCDADRLEEWPTGYIMDVTLLDTFKKHFKETGSAWRAFNAAIDKAVDVILTDIDYYQSEDYAIETAEFNDHWFFADGSIAWEEDIKAS